MTDPSMSSAPSAAKRYKPYFAPSEVAFLVAQNAGKFTPARTEAIRQLACGLIDKIGSRLGFPRRTIATAQVLYHRFHLFFPLRDFAVQDVAVASLLVSSKLEDTLKKLREIQIAAYQIKAAQEGLGTALQEPDPQILEADRARLIGVERLILETISFNFNLRSSAAYASREAMSPASQNQDVFAYVIKLGKFLRASKDYVNRAFRMAIDAHRTLIPLSYPPHAIAAACLFLTGFLTSDQAEGGSPDFQDGWAASCKCDMEDVEDICHSILDLLLSMGTSAKTSLSEQLPSQSPREGATSSSLHTGAALTSELTQIKIRLRGDAEKRQLEEDNMHAAYGEESDILQPNKRRRTASRPTSMLASQAFSMDSPSEDREKEFLGRDDVTVRFLWDIEGQTQSDVP